MAKTHLRYPGGENEKKGVGVLKLRVWNLKYFYHPSIISSNVLVNTEFNFLVAVGRIDHQGGQRSHMLQKSQVFFLRQTDEMVCLF